MIVYKWILKYGEEYYPIINNGAYRPFDRLKLEPYKKGKTIKNFINPYEQTKNVNRYKQHNFHRAGYHFWRNNNNKYLDRYNQCMLRRGKKINCTLKCYIRNKDIILQDNERIIASKFRILGEVK